MDARIATALAFGIKTDTLGFSRTFNPVDIRALSWLNAWVDPELMKSIESPPRSRDTLQSFVSAFTNMKKSKESFSSQSTNYQIGDACSNRRFPDVDRRN